MTNEQIQHKLENFFKKRSTQPTGYLEWINPLYELAYFSMSKSLYDNLEQSQQKRDDKWIIVILAHLSLEAFINRIGIEILPAYVENFPVGFDLNSSLDNDKFMEKFEKYPKIITGNTFDKSKKFWKDLYELNHDRNKLVHVIPKKINFLNGEKNHEFISNDNILKLRFDTVNNIVDYLLNDLGIPHFPEYNFLRVFNYTNPNIQKPPIGSFITNF